MSKVGDDPRGEKEIVNDPRFDERRRELAQHHRSQTVRLLLAFIALLVVIGGGYWLAEASPFFALTRVNVEITGTEVPRSFVVAIADRNIGRNYFHLDTQALVRALEVNPLVGRVVVSRNFPHSLTVKVTPSVPAFVVQTGGVGSTEVAINARLQAMPQVPIPPSTAAACVAAIPFTGASGDFTCAATTPLGAVTPLLARVAKLKEGLAALHFTVSGIYVFAGFGIGVSTYQGIMVYFSDNASDGAALAALGSLSRSGVLPSGAVVDLSNPTHPVVSP